MSNDFPNQWLTDSESLLFGLIDDFTQISFISVFHENVDVLFWTVKETFVKSDNIGMIQGGKDSYLIGGIIFFIIAKAKTLDLNKMETTFFIATGFSYYFLLTKKTFP